MSDENDNDNHETEIESGTPILKRAKMLPVEGVVYCLEHGAVHEDTTDPYRTSEEECSKDEHRRVYYGARKGDIDETVEAEMYSEHRVIAAASGSALTENERGVVLGLIRMAIKKVARNREGAKRLFGSEYDPSQHDQRLKLLEDARGKLED